MRLRSIIWHDNADVMERVLAANRIANLGGTVMRRADGAWIVRWRG